MQLSSNQTGELTAQKRPLKWPSTVLMVLILGVAIVSVGGAMQADSSKTGSAIDTSAANSPLTVNRPVTAAKFAVQIRKPTGPPRVETDIMDAHGNVVTVACATCHTTRQPNYENKTVKELDEFHVGLRFNHGSVSCLSCHNSNDYDSLKLADGNRVAFTDVMTLCAQCHGPQMKDYLHGAHGGMNGYWDLKQGPQVKNNCVDCHNPHSPQFPKMKPTFKPKDRFLEKAEH